MYSYHTCEKFFKGEKFHCCIIYCKMNCVKTFVFACHMFYTNNFLFFQFYDKTFVLFIKLQNFSCIWNVYT